MANKDEYTRNLSDDDLSQVTGGTEDHIAGKYYGKFKWYTFTSVESAVYEVEAADTKQDAKTKIEDALTNVKAEAGTWVFKYARYWIEYINEDGTTTIVTPETLWH